MWIRLIQKSVHVTEDVNRIHPEISACNTPVKCTYCRSCCWSSCTQTSVSRLWLHHPPDRLREKSTSNQTWTWALQSLMKVWEPESSVTFHHLLQMLPQDIPHEIRSEIQESVLSQVAQLQSAHVKLEEADVGQTELSGRPVQPLQDVLLGPLARVCRQRERYERIRAVLKTNSRDHERLTVGDPADALHLGEAVKAVLQRLTDHGFTAGRQQRNRAHAGICRPQRSVSAYTRSEECMTHVLQGLISKHMTSGIWSCFLK